jgi:hypothetical protein
MAAKKTARKKKKTEGSGAAGESKKGTPSKAEFVRSLPPGTSFADAAEKAKSLGIELSKAYYYVLKSELKKGGGKLLSRSRSKGPRGRVSAVAGLKSLRLSSDDPAENALLAAVRKLGSSRARAIIDAVERFER